HRQGVRMTRADVDEVNVHAIDRCHELRQGIELGLPLAPVVVRTPVAHQLLEFCELYALRLVIDRLPVGPARGRDASAKISKLLLRNIDLEGPDCAVITGRSKLPWQKAGGTPGCCESKKISSGCGGCGHGILPRGRVAVEHLGDRSVAVLSRRSAMTGDRCNWLERCCAFLLNNFVAN